MLEGFDATLVELMEKHVSDIHRRLARNEPLEAAIFDFIAAEMAA